MPQVQAHLQCSVGDEQQRGRHAAIEREEAVLPRDRGQSVHQTAVLLRRGQALTALDLLMGRSQTGNE